MQYHFNIMHDGHVVLEVQQLASLKEEASGATLKFDEYEAPHTQPWGFDMAVHCLESAPCREYDQRAIARLFNATKPSSL